MNFNLVDLPSYCATIVVVEQLRVPGRRDPVPGGGGAATGAAAAVGRPLFETVLALPGQRTIHNMLEAADGVFSTYSAFTRIHSGTFLVEQFSGMVLVSMQGHSETVRCFNPDQLVPQIDLNLQWMAAAIRQWLFRNQRPVPVIEVEQGLLHLMENEGFSMWPVIRHHSSLVPLVNRPDLLLRLHDHLVNVVICTNLNGYWRVLGLLQANGQWHAAITNNTHLAQFYSGSFYNSTDQTPEVQGFQLLRYHRNPASHGLEHSVPAGPADPSTVPAAPLPAAALPRGFVPRVAAQQGVIPVQPSFARWQIGLMQYGEWHLFLHHLERGMHLIGELCRVAIEFLFVYPRR